MTDEIEPRERVKTRRLCKVCGKPFLIWRHVEPRRRYCSGPCVIEAEREQRRERKRKFRKNMIANRVAANPHYVARTGPRKRVLVPGRVQAERKAEAMASEREAERIRSGGPDPWD